MERQTNELLFLMLVAKMDTSIALIYWFGRKVPQTFIVGKSGI